MLRKNFLILSLSLFLVQVSIVPGSRADSSKDFVMSCTYGVLAGTLVGTATLAFADKPGDNLNRIARGASLGLYAGILLGLYVVNLSSGGNEEEPVSHFHEPKLQVYPVISEQHGIEGGTVHYSLFQF